MFKRGTYNEFHNWSIGRFYWAKRYQTPAHSEYFLHLFGGLYMSKRDPNRLGSRFTDDDIVFGPLTVAKTDGRNFGLVLRSANREDDETHVTLTGYLLGYGFRLYLPELFKPVMEKNYVGDAWDAATKARLGRDWYPTYHNREYGFSCYDGHFSLYYGMQNSNGWGGKMINRRKGFFLPWTQWRFVGHTLFDADGNVFYNYQHTNDKANKDMSSEKKAECSAQYFLIRDYDGKKIVARTIIEERRWEKGDSWCKWLSFFVKPMVRRVLDIQFAEEVGTGKGSWKGGLCGTSEDVISNDTHEQTFIRYTMKEYNAKEGRYKIEYIRRVDPAELIHLVPAKCSW